MSRKKKATQGRKNTHKRVKITRDTITLPKAGYQPTRAEMEEVIPLEESLGVPIEFFGDTPEERMRNLIRHQFRQVKIVRED